MKSLTKSLIIALLMGLTFSACGKKDEPIDHGMGDKPPSESSATPGASARPSAAETSVTPASGFDINRVPVVNPQLGKFPYFSLIEGYQRDKGGDNKDVAFDRYEFFDGAKINTVEGRLSTIEAEGRDASAFQVLKTYESLVTGLGGVKVFEGTGEAMDTVNSKFNDMRHRQPVYSGDQMGVYLLRTPEKDIWVEAYIRQHGKDGTYFLTVVEKKTLEVKASLLPAEEMKRELDSKGHVALYINFEFDKADIKSDSKPLIDQIVKLLKNNPTLNVTVEGHTDNVGAPAYNKKLSDARAKSVVAALTAQGIEVPRLKAMGYGQDKPIGDNATDDGRAKNRRVELVKA